MLIDKLSESNRIYDMEQIDINKISGTNLRRLRLKKGLSQLELAERVGIRNKSDISPMENGKRGFGKSLLEKFCNALDARPKDFYEENTRHLGISQSSPCTSSQMCQDLCAICESLPEHMQEQLLKYAKFIRQDYIDNTRASTSNGITQTGTGVINNDSGEHAR